jgi:hypothetical protein
VYEVTPAYNQPDWEEKGKMFFPLPAGAMSPHLLLSREDYVLVTPVLVNEISPRPQSVFELFDGHPERWTQEAYGMERANGMWTDKREEACKVCLGVALGLVYPKENDWTKLNAATDRLFRVIHAETIRREGFDEAKEYLLDTRWIIDWNDKHGRTVEEVAQACKDARI